MRKSYKSAGVPLDAFCDSDSGEFRAFCKTESEDYASIIDSAFTKLYDFANRLKINSDDPSAGMESVIVTGMASRINALFPDVQVGEIIGKNMHLPKEILAVKTIDHILETAEKPTEKTVLTALRIALAITTNAMTTAPLEGISSVKFKKNSDGSVYLAVYYNSPIRSAGGTEQALSILFAEYIRQKLGLSKYAPLEEEGLRMHEEIRLYERNVGHLQYSASTEEILFAYRNLPVEITGDATEKISVSGYVNLPRIETNNIRGGAILVFNDGLLGKAPKVQWLAKNVLQIAGWEWLEELLKKRMPSTIKKTKTEIIIGRPLFSVPDMCGGFRVVYGRARHTGFASAGISPATMVVLENFIAAATQLVIEGPGKACVAIPVEGLRGPFVVLDDGAAMFVNTVKLASEIKHRVKKILFLGDILISVGEFIENKHALYSPGYDENLWLAIARKNNVPVPEKITEDLAIELSHKYKIPIHPEFACAWENLSFQEYMALVKHFCSAIATNDGVVADYDSSIKNLLEKIYVEHKILPDGKIYVKNKAFLECLLLSNNNPPENDVISTINSYTRVRVYRFAGKYLGVRMGRPEKTAPREMSPPAHVIFPVSSPKRTITENLSAVLAFRQCKRCNKLTYKRFHCGHRLMELPPGNLMNFSLAEEIRHLREKYRGVEVKGIRNNENIDVPESLEKGFIRAAYSLPVFRDGTLRIDATNAVMTHFTPREINTDISTLRKLGYTKDIFGKPLEHADQILELFPQDIIVPVRCAEFLCKVANFIDLLVEKYYCGGIRIYNCKGISDLAGHLVAGISPHTIMAVTGRIIGFTKYQCVFAHPLWHAAKRRNCDGDADSLILLMDLFLNYSRKYLPARVGAEMDTPRFIQKHVLPAEVDDEAYSVDAVWQIPYEFYELAEKNGSADDAAKIIKTIGPSVRDIGFSHKGNLPVDAPPENAYSQISDMDTKLEKQINLAKKIAASDIQTLVESVIHTHIFPDILGNLRSFFAQKFRCQRCNMHYQIPPLNGICVVKNCGGKILPTVFPKNVLKYAHYLENLSEYCTEYTLHEIERVYQQVALFTADELFNFM